MSHWVKRAQDRRGFTLVELLVVLVILAIVGGIVASSLIRGLQVDAQARNRIEAFEDMQIVMERMSREIRAANPIVSADSVADRLEVQVQRNEQCLRFEYVRDGEQLLVTERRFGAECVGTPSVSTQVLLRDLEPTPVFEFERIDAAGQRTALPDGSFTEATATDIKFVTITLAHTLELDQSPVTVRSLVGIRNN